MRNKNLRQALQTPKKVHTRHPAEVERERGLMNNMKMRKEKLNLNKSCFVCLVIIFSGCNMKPENFELEKTFLGALENTNCYDTIKLSSLTTFDWDRFYLIPNEYTEENIENIIGFKFNCFAVPKFHERFLFVNDKEKDAEFFDISYEEGIIFNCLELKFNYLSPNQAVFVPSRMKASSKVRYYLNPIYCPDSNFIFVQCEF